MRDNVQPIYRPSGERGEIIVYAGDLAVTQGTDTGRVRGRLTLCLNPAPRLSAHFAGPASDLHVLTPCSGVEPSVAIPDGAPLTPPTGSALPGDPGDIDWVSDPDITMNEIAHGDVTAATRFVVHISGALDARSFPPVKVVGGGRQRQLEFGLRPWDLVIAQVDGPSRDGFGLVVEARAKSETSPADVDALARRLFILLSFMAGREVGVSPVCGLDDAGDVVWATWAAPRMRPGRPGACWCPPYHIAAALPDIVKGFNKLSENESLDAVVDRAVNHLLAADGSEPLDVRIPIAWSGLEDARVGGTPA